MHNEGLDNMTLYAWQMTKPFDKNHSTSLQERKSGNYFPKFTHNFTKSEIRSSLIKSIQNLNNSS